MKLSQQTKRKVAKQKVSMTYSHYDEDIDEEGWLLVGIFACVIGCWWGFIHLLDKFTFNFMPWYAEPFTIFPVGGYFVVADFYGKNPLHWWPLIWGYKMCQ